MNNDPQTFLWGALQFIHDSSGVSEWSSRWPNRKWILNDNLLWTNSMLLEIKNNIINNNNTSDMQGNGDDGP